MGKFYTYRIVLVFLALPLVGYSQYYYNKPYNQWVFGFGPSQALTDVGGSHDIGTHFLKDWNWSAIRYGGEVGYRHYFSSSVAARGTLTLGMLSGNDALTTNDVRHNRNLNFRSPIGELTLTCEYYFYQSSHIGHRYHIKHAKGFKRYNWDAYVFAGIGGFFFNPQGKYINGVWYNLAPLSTEGEGLPGGIPRYSQFAFCIPAGIGIKLNLNPQFTIGLEISDRIWTSTDYLDDAHGVYFDNNAILKAKGPIAAYFADPNLGEIGGATYTGGERADSKHNDAYFFTFITFTYQPSRFHRRTRSKF
jgi:hypothetical protein